MRSEGADDLLRLLRNVYFQQESTGSADVDMAAAPAISASSLGLIESNEARRFRLTTQGYRIANFAKEYSNWIDSGRRLPEGISAELVAGRRLLDVGCGFGRHLATFGRLGARAVGIEFEEPYFNCRACSRSAKASCGPSSRGRRQRASRSWIARSTSSSAAWC